MNTFIKTITAIAIFAVFFVVTYAVDKSQDDDISRIWSAFGLIADRVDDIDEKSFQQDGDDLVLGASLQYVGGGVYKLSNSISATDSSVTLTKFTVPVSDYELSMTDFGDIGYMTLDPGTSKREFISFTGVTQDSGSTKATLTGVTRGLSFISPYTASTTLRQAHSGGSRAIVSNPPQLYNALTAKANDEAITGLWSFNSYLPTSSITATSGSQFAIKTYVDNVANQGAGTSSESVAGLIEQATQLEMASSTAFDADNPHAINSEYASSTPSGTSATGLYAIISKTNGKLSQLWIDLTEAFTFSGGVAVTGGFTSDNATSTNATTTEMYVSNDLWVDGGIGTSTAGNMVVGTTTITGLTIDSCDGCLGTHEINSSSCNYDGASPARAQATITCTSGYKVISGGVNFSNTGAVVNNLSSYPSSATTWVFDSYTAGGDSSSNTCYTICIKE